MAKFHFVEDYERHVARLLRKHPRDEAMSLAVGGSYEEIGQLAADMLIHAGLGDAMSLFDFGCGSGRVAHAVAQRVALKGYLGTDVVQSLLTYAKTRCPEHYRFVRHRALNVPAADATFDMACAFSVFTHLLLVETYLYMTDIHRVLKPGGRLVMSFLELAEPAHWTTFADSAEAQKKAPGTMHLNAYLERDQIAVLASRIGFAVIEFIGGFDPRWDGRFLGQSVAILEKA